MKIDRLGNSDLNVSEICLGTMTFGQQNTLEEAHQQLDFVIDSGVNFIDTAEMYPVPPQAETQGRTSEYIGQWLVKQPRDKVVVATKISAFASRLPWIRSADRKLDRTNIEKAIDDSLKRLQTDYVDLYQIHWPDRYVTKFGSPSFDPQNDRESVPILEQLQVFKDLIDAGKIRYLGLSNETPWGICQFCSLADAMGLPRVVSVQNAYNLINREFETTLAETSYRENIPLLPYSPLAFGYLTGKHLDGTPENSRLGLFPNFGRRYNKPNVQVAIKEYVELARQVGISPAQMALAFVRTRWFVASTIIGATTLEQLRENIDSASIELTDDILDEIEKIHAKYPNPAP
ncbi:MAG: aldo/keto reductase [Cyanobacteria bacterium SID2]|nr:aldo/keto reductase [Cyanobacteria bacterium SID2]MBP0004315.1 aldo/keto reductase [Cyanobacteria bacterium SBC]